MGGRSHNFKWNGQRRSERWRWSEEMRAWGWLGHENSGRRSRSVLFMIFFFFLNWGTWRVAINWCSKDQSGLVEGGQEFSFRQVTFKVLIRYWSGDTHLASGYENQLVRARLKTSVCGWIKGLSVGRKGEGKKQGKVQGLSPEILSLFRGRGMNGGMGSDKTERATSEKQDSLGECPKN